MDRAARPLLPYVPRLVVDWLEEHPALVCADARRDRGLRRHLRIHHPDREARPAREGRSRGDGRHPQPRLRQLLDSAYQYGAELVKWGGDAVLLLFRGEQHPLLAAAAAHRMQAVIERVGRVRTSSGTVRLGMSIGLHSGTLDCLLVGEVFRDLVVTGPDAGLVAQLEAAAAAGQVVVSERTAAVLTAAGGSVGPVVGPGRLLVEPAPVAPVAGPGPAVRTTDVELRRALPPPIARHVRRSRGRGLRAPRGGALLHRVLRGRPDPRGGRCRAGRGRGGPGGLRSPAGGRGPRGHVPGHRPLPGRRQGDPRRRSARRATATTPPGCSRRLGRSSTASSRCRCAQA